MDYISDTSDFDRLHNNMMIFLMNKTHLIRRFKAITAYFL